MNRIIIYTFTFLALQLVGCASVPKKDNTELSLRKSLPIQIFMGTCVVGRASSDAVASQALEMGFSEARSNVAQSYLRGNSGRAWHLKNEQGEFGLTALNNSLCSVFIHQGEPEKLQASMESWLPPGNSGFSYKKELVSQSEYLTTTSYQLFRAGKLVEQWVITLNSQPDAELVAIMSYDSP
ncbi:hypothetical protein [Microbulbifer sp. 2205BS26-8]|uniref:NMCC_0638 family (lipo)protein n=1 Tax=Microbulbifer sp. 2205BS26-8 TaxID=3064386 RepID=UPI00273D1892|nr:hypothetical protein [Microbulbifer sp. 2205BS26-8]MDP5209048.1 hypothetical protein [Microbulbifer sp. 2205BS26-8]